MLLRLFAWAFFSIAARSKLAMLVRVRSINFSVSELDAFSANDGRSLIDRRGRSAESNSSSRSGNLLWGAMESRVRSARDNVCRSFFGDGEAADMEFNI